MIARPDPHFYTLYGWQTDLLDHYLSNVPVIMGDLILTEVLQGFKSNKDFETARGFLRVLSKISSQNWRSDLGLICAIRLSKAAC